MAGGDANGLESLVDRVRSGDQSAFDALVRRTHRLAFQLALRMVGNESEAEDVLQEAYLRVWQGLDRLRDRKAVLGWICQLVRNVASDRLRRRARRDATDPLEPLLMAIREGATDPHSELADAQERVAIAEVVSQLKDKHRLVLLLREVDGMSYEQISAALGCPIGTVESRLFRARKLVAAKLRRLRRKQAEEAA